MFRSKQFFCVEVFRPTRPWRVVYWAASVLMGRMFQVVPSTKEALAFLRPWQLVEITKLKLVVFRHWMVRMGAELTEVVV